jgi:hypothetical protein
VKFGKSGKPPEPAPSLARDNSSQFVSPLSDGATTSLVQEIAARNVDHDEDEMVRRQVELEAKLRQMNGRGAQAQRDPARQLAGGSRAWR